MAQDGEVNVKLKITAENGGVEKAEQGLKRIKRSAKNTAEETKSGFKQLQEAGGKVNAVFGALKNLLAGFGAANALIGIIDAVKTIRESFSAAKKEAEEFAKAADAKKVQESIDALAKSYGDLTESITKSNEASQSEKKIEDIKLKNRRDLEDANIDLAEQRELAAIDENDPAAAEAKAEIQATYKAKRDRIAIQRGEYDGVRERDELRSSALTDRKNADRIEEAAKATDAEIKKAEQRRNEHLAKSVSTNKEDYTGFWSMLGANAKRTFSLDWGKINDERSEKGNEIRKKEQEAADAEEARIKSLKDDAEAKRKSAEALRTSATQKEKEADALGGSVEVQQVKEQVVKLQGKSAVAAAVRATDKKDKEEADKQAKLEDAKMASVALQEEKSRTEIVIASAQFRKAEAARSVATASDNLETAKLRGNRKSQQAAQAELVRAKEAAQNVNFEADRTITALNATLTEINGKLKMTESILNRNKQQQNYNLAESAAGS